jgi:hypothetical protein
MAVRLTVTAVIAHDRRFDDAGTLGARGHCELSEACGNSSALRLPADASAFASGGGSLPELPRNRFAYQRSQFLVCHAVTSTLSMIPTIAASTGAAFLPSASPAARPSITTRTLS